MVGSTTPEHTQCAGHGGWWQPALFMAPAPFLIGATSGEEALQANRDPSERDKGLEKALFFLDNIILVRTYINTRLICFRDRIVFRPTHSVGDTSVVLAIITINSVGASFQRYIYGSPVLCPLLQKRS